MSSITTGGSGSHLPLSHAWKTGPLDVEGRRGVVPVEQSQGSVLRFGHFELDLHNRELRRNGLVVSLQPIPFKVLTLLASHPQELLTREDIQHEAWPGEVAGDFSDRIHFCIGKIRGALGEDASQPRFVKTVHKAGYMFIAPVQHFSTSASVAGPSLPTELVAGQGGADGLDSPVGRVSAVEASPASGETAGRLASTETLGTSVLAPEARGRTVGERPVDEGWARRPRSQRWVLWSVLLAGGLLIAVTAWLTALPSPSPEPIKYEELTSDGRYKLARLACDGAAVYFVEQTPSGYALCQVSTSGGDAVPIADAKRYTSIQGIRPDRSELLLIETTGTGPGPLRALSLTTRAVRRVGTMLATAAAWSPDGMSLAYTDHDALYVGGPDGSNPRRLTAVPGDVRELAWSPDGREISFGGIGPGGGSLWQMRTDGSGARHPPSGWGSSGCWAGGVWTPDGKYFIFDSLHAEHCVPTAVRVPRGVQWPSQPRPLSSGPVDFGPFTASAVGARLYALGMTGLRSQVQRLDARVGKFLPYLSGLSADYVDFSRDGEWIAYVATGSEELWKARKDGSQKVRLTQPPLSVELPRWSPDGKWIAFMGHKPSEPWRVRVVSAVGGDCAPLTAINDAEGAPTWSPDGLQLAFGGLLGSPFATLGPLVIYVFDLRTHRLSALKGSEGLHSARWSPDGRYIAALTRDWRTVMLLDFRTGRWRKLATLRRIWDLAWLKRQEALYLRDDPSNGDSAIYRVQIRGNHLERVASLKGDTGQDWLGVAPDDSPLLTRRVSGQEIYAIDVKWP